MPDIGAHPSRRFGLGAKFLGLAVLIGNKFDVHDRLQPIIDNLSRTIGETVHLGILSDNEVVHVAIGFPDQGPHLAVQLGARSLAHTTALGKAILATFSDEAFDLRYPVEELESRTPRSIRSRSGLRRDLQETQRRGYAIDDEESRLGVRCLAFPIFGATGEAVAAISVTTTPARIMGVHAQVVVRSLREAAVRATEALGGRAQNYRRVESTAMVGLVESPRPRESPRRRRSSFA